MTVLTESQVSKLVGALRGVLVGAAAPETVLANILEQAVGLTGASRGVFVEVGEEGELALSVLHSYRADSLRDPGHYSRTIFAKCVASGEDVLLQDARSELPADQRRSAVVHQMGSVLCMPVRAGGRIAGLVHLENPQIGHFGEQHRQWMRPLLDLATPVLEALAAGRAVLHERDRLAREAEANRQLLALDWTCGRFVGRGAAARELATRILKGAEAPFPVLLIGETGTGKSVLARIVHSASPRASAPLVTVFCPSLDAHRVEAELFGYRRGAFTGAETDRPGKVQKAEGGTLFLDEIGELPPEVQPKLLRLLQEKTFERLGDPEERHADVRVIAATNREIEREVREGRFRRDLFERLNFVTIRVPPLRERREDIPAILRHCLDATAEGRRIEVSQEALAWLEKLDHPWPGNVRHLEQLAARLTLEAPSGPVGPADLERLLERTDPEAIEGSVPTGPRPPQPRREPSNALPPPPGGDGENLSQFLARCERERIEFEVRSHPELTRAQQAARLGISEATLYKRLNDYGLK